MMIVFKETTTVNLPVFQLELVTGNLTSSTLISLLSTWLFITVL